MSTLKISKGLLPTQIMIPGSKSYANRLLILAALKKSSFTLNNVPEAFDVAWMVKCLKALGLIITEEGSRLIVTNSFPACELAGGEIEVGEGGTTARFLAAFLLKGKAPYVLKLGGRLKDRPWEEFIEFVKKHGGKAKLEGDRLSLQGPLLLPKNIVIDCSRTTQFASAMKLAFSDVTQVTPLNLHSSKSYWEMTEKLISAVASKDHYSVPMDWSSASYPLAFAALNQEIFFPELEVDLTQADAKFMTLLEQFHCVSYLSNGIKISPIKTHHDVALDVSDCLDLVPTLGYFLSQIPGKHKLNGIENLVHKESDRLSEVQLLLAAFERKSEVSNGSLIIYGKADSQAPKNVTVADDHRMVMVASLFLRHHQGGSISPAEAVNKSYPQFFDLFKI